jgi:hypothetical protein
VSSAGEEVAVRPTQKVVRKVKPARMGGKAECSRDLRLPTHDMSGAQSASLEALSRFLSRCRPQSGTGDGNSSKQGRVRVGRPCGHRRQERWWDWAGTTRRVSVGRGWWRSRR